jgi:hypothetical protein
MALLNFDEKNEHGTRTRKQKQTSANGLLLPGRNVNCSGTLVSFKLDGGLKAVALAHGCESFSGVIQACSFSTPETSLSSHCSKIQMASVDDVRIWRVTAENPPSSGEELDYERCAALHNTILKLGWVGCGLDLADLGTQHWWDSYGSEDLENQLAPSLVEFLKRVIRRPNGDWTWHWFLDGIVVPDIFFDHDNECDSDDSDYEEDRFVWLYSYPSAGGHTNGLM